MRISWLAALALAALLWHGVPEARAQSEPPRLVATIPPIHSLVAMVSEGVAQPELIMEPGASLHHFALRPSHARSIQNADLVFRIGPMTEVWAESILGTAAETTRIVTLAATDGVVLLAARQTGLWTQHASNAHDHAHDARDKDVVDPHLWLDPVNARLWLDTIARELAAFDPHRATRYEANARAAIERLASIEAAIARDLEPVLAVPYFVFHDAYHYFEDRFGLSPAGSLSLSDASAPGVAHIKAVRRLVGEQAVGCVFAEPQFNQSLIRTVIEGTGARIGILDPIGSDLEPGPALYPALLERLSASLLDCLATGKS